MEAKAETFLKNVASQYSGQSLQKKEVRKILDEAISSLSAKQSRMQKYLKKFFNKSTKKICIFLQETDTMTSPSHYRESLQRMLIMENTNSPEFQETILSAFEECGSLKSRIAFAQKLCCIVIAKKSPDVIHCIANALFNVFDKDVENILEKEDKSSSSLKLVLKNLFTILITSYSTSNKEQTRNHVPAFNDIVAAVFSLIIDLTIFESRSSTDSKECVKQGKLLVETGVSFLGKHHDKLLDSILQSSASHLNNADLIFMPLYKFIVLKQSWSSQKLDEEKYLRCIAASMQAISLLKNRKAKVSESIRIVALQIPAPDHFYEWVSLRKGGSKLLDETPLLKNTSSIAVTKILMTECDAEMMERFLDLCTIEVVEDEAVDEEVVTEEIKESLQEKPSELLFVLDTKPKKPVTFESIAQSIEQIETTPSDQESGEHSDEELLKQTDYLLASESENDDRMDDVTDQDDASETSNSDSTNETDLQLKTTKPQKLKKKKVTNSKSVLEEPSGFGSTLDMTNSTERVKKKKAKKSEVTHKDDDALTKSRKKTKKVKFKTAQNDEKLIKSSKKLSKTASSETDENSLSLLNSLEKAVKSNKELTKKSSKSILKEQMQAVEKITKKTPTQTEKRTIKDDKISEQAKKHSLKNADKSEKIESHQEKVSANIASAEMSILGEKMSKSQKRKLKVDIQSGNETPAVEMSQKKATKKSLDDNTELKAAKRSKKSAEKENEVPLRYEKDIDMVMSSLKKDSKNETKCKLKTDSGGKREKTLTKSQKKRKMLLQTLSEPDSQSSILASKSTVAVEKTPAKTVPTNVETPKHDISYSSTPNKEFEFSVKKMKKNKERAADTRKPSKTPSSVNKKAKKKLEVENAIKGEETTRLSSEKKSSKKKLSPNALKQALLLQIKQSAASEEVSNYPSYMEEEEESSNESPFDLELISKDLKKDFADLSTTQDNSDVHLVLLEDAESKANPIKDLSNASPKLVEKQKSEKSDLRRSSKKKQQTPVKSDAALSFTGGKSTESLEQVKLRNKKTKQRKSVVSYQSVPQVADTGVEMQTQNPKNSDIAITENLVPDQRSKDLRAEEAVSMQSVNKSDLASKLQSQLENSHEEDELSAKSPTKTIAAKIATDNFEAAIIFESNFDNVAKNGRSGVTTCSTSTSAEKCPVTQSASVGKEPNTPKKAGNAELKSPKSAEKSKRLSRSVGKTIQSLSSDGNFSTTASSTEDEALNESIVPASDVELDTEQVGVILKDRSLSHSQGFDNPSLEKTTGETNNNLSPEITHLDSGKSSKKNNLSAKEFPLSGSPLLEKVGKNEQSPSRSIGAMNETSNNEDVVRGASGLVPPDKIATPVLIKKSKTRKSTDADDVNEEYIVCSNKKSKASPKKLNKAKSPKKIATKAKVLSDLPKISGLTDAKHAASVPSKHDVVALSTSETENSTFLDSPTELAQLDSTLALDESFDKNPNWLEKEDAPQSEQDDQILRVLQSKTPTISLNKQEKGKSRDAYDNSSVTSNRSDDSEGKIVLVISDSEDGSLNDIKTSQKSHTKDTTSQKNAMPSTEDESNFIDSNSHDLTELQSVVVDSTSEVTFHSVEAAQIVDIDSLKSSISSSANSTTSYLTAKESLADTLSVATFEEEQSEPSELKDTESEQVQKQSQPQSKQENEVEKRSLRPSVEKERSGKIPKNSNPTATPHQKTLRVVVEDSSDMILSQTSEFSDGESELDAFEPPKKRSKRNVVIATSSQSSVASEKDKDVIVQLSPISEGTVFVPRRSTRINRTRVTAENRIRSDSESSMDSSSGYSLRRSKRLSQATPRKPRTDSESSTASHSYGTRSRK